MPRRTATDPDARLDLEDLGASEPLDVDSTPATVGLDGFATRTHDATQAGLFPDDDLILPETLRSMRKAVAAIHAVPVAGGKSRGLNSLRLMDALIVIAQVDFRRRGREALQRVKDERLAPLFEVRITELARLAGIPGKNYQRLYAELDALFEMVLMWNIVGESKDTEWKMKGRLLSSLGIGQGRKRGLVRFSMDPGVLEIILEPSSWATLSLQVMNGLPTAASYALYQNAWRYVGTQAKVTAALPVATWVELLVGPSRYVTEEDGEKRVHSYGDFKRRVLDDALRRVNDVQALHYTLKLREIKSGNRVTKLQFQFIPKPTLSLGIPLTWPQELVSVLASIGMTPKEIEDLAQGHSYEEVADSLVKLKQAEDRLRSQGRGISSKKAYFLGILANVADGAKLDDIDPAQVEAEVRAKEAAQQAQARSERLRTEFDQFCAGRFAQALFDAPADLRDSLIEAFSSTEQARSAAVLVSRGWSPKNPGALSLLRAWMGRERPEALAQLLANPEEQSFEAWLAWRLDSAGQ
ncbi:MAG: RepB family plasmid replication initiator protein [Burkholderiales bacterium]|nr:MAG: RepB family plasmid replication initiator protein [Burkholderiales bacterium]